MDSSKDWNMNRFKNPFSVNRFEMMTLSGIGFVNTYARCMKELNQWSYIEYFPSANLHSGSHISCIRFDITTDTGSDTASDTLLINITNKEGYSDNLKKERGKNGNRKNRLNASLDKDYSEPL